MACEISKLVEQLQAKAEKGLVNGLPLDVAVIRLKAAYGKQQVAKVTKKADKAVARAQEKYEAALGTKIERTGTAVKEKIEHNGVTFIPTESEKYNDRTLINASADATIAFAVDFTTAGEKLTKRYVGELGRLYIPVDATKDVTDQAVDNIVDQLNKIEAKSLNIAGNGLYTFKGKTQEEVDTKMLELLSKITSHSKLKKPITLIKSGAQTGADEAGIKAAQKLGIKVESAIPGNWMFKDGKGNTITDKNRFLSRFGAVSNNSTFEVSTKGDSLGKKFSARNAKLKDGRTIEQAWAEAKGYKTIEEAKGKSAKVKGFKYKEVYFGLWEQWAEENPDLIKELAEKTEGMTLVDSFAKTENNQANALTQIVENYRKGEGVTSENGMLKVQTFDKAKPVMVFADGKTSKVFNSIEELADFAFEYNSIMGKAGKIAIPQDQRMVGRIFGMLKNANIPFKPIRVELAKGKDEAGTERGLYEVKGHRITMYYNNKYTGANPAQVVLHEYVHAITVGYLDKNIELKKKVRALMDHVAKENEGLTTWYAMKDEKEFLAEAIAEPKFREALAAIRPMNKRSVLQYVKDLFEELLNSLTNASIKEANAFTEALELVIEVANAGEAPFDTVTEKKGIEIQSEWYTRKDTQNNPDKVYVFGDNIVDAESGVIPSSTQAVVRGLDNAVGINTRVSKTKDFTAEDLGMYKEYLDNVFKELYKLRDKGKTIVFPKDGLATGKSGGMADELYNELAARLNDFTGIKDYMPIRNAAKKETQATESSQVEDVDTWFNRLKAFSYSHRFPLAPKIVVSEENGQVFANISASMNTDITDDYVVQTVGEIVKKLEPYREKGKRVSVNGSIFRIVESSRTAAPIMYILDMYNNNTDRYKESLINDGRIRNTMNVYAGDIDRYLTEQNQDDSAFYKETIPTKGKVQLSSDIIEAAKNCK